MSNKLYYGDNLDVLRKYIKDETVDLCYIDPPFNSKRNYNQIYLNQGKEDKAQSQAFIDTWEWNTRTEKELNEIYDNEKALYSKQTIMLMQGLVNVIDKGSLMAYLVSMTIRIAEIHRVLKDTGSFYLHCDPTASHYLKLVCDGIFCAKGGDFKNEIIWRRHYSHNDGYKFGWIHDVLLFYTKSDKYTYNTQFIPYDDEYIKKNYTLTDDKTGKKYRSVSMNAQGQGEPKYFGNNLLYPPKGTHWRWTQERINEAINSGIIYFTKNGVPRYKQFLENVEGLTVQDTWIDFYSLSSHDKERLGYPTQKPETLLERIINTSTNKKDVVLDAFCGCGTTIAVAERLKRTWIGIDITFQSISLILHRLEKSFGENKFQKMDIELNGIPKDIESAIALANKVDDRTRKEFEKWCVLTYSKNRAAINEKKGKDGGIDGIAYIQDFKGDKKQEQELKQIVFSVKSDLKPKPSYVRDLIGVMQRENAVMGIFITLYEPTKDMIQEAEKQGIYENKMFNLEFPKVLIVSVKDILNNHRLNIPKTQEYKVVKSAKYQAYDDNEQGLLDL